MRCQSLQVSCVFGISLVESPRRLNATLQEKEQQRRHHHKINNHEVITGTGPA